MRDDAGFGRAGGGELGRLTDVLAEHDLAGELVPQPRLLQCLARSDAVGRYVRIGDGEVRNLSGRQRIAEALQLAVDRNGGALGRDDADAPAREDDGRAFGQSLGRELLDALVVGGKQHLERRGLLDLLHEVARRTVGDAHFLPRLLLELRRDLIERVAQARGGGDGCARVGCGDRSSGRLLLGARQRQRERGHEHEAQQRD